MGGGNKGSSIPLPRISGFSEEIFFSHLISADYEHQMSQILSNPRFQKGNRGARSYANLVILFRMLLFYGALKHDPRFWDWVTTDWGIIFDKSRGGDKNKGYVSSIANFYSDARYAALGADEQRLSLLVRLVDEWLMIRPRAEFSYSQEVDDVTIQKTREGWLNIRDYHVDMLMDSKLPASLVGVEPPAKMVTSLWEPDPEVVAILKEVKIKTSRRPKAYFKKPAAHNPPVVGSQPRASSPEKKRKADLSDGEIDEIDSNSIRTGFMYDERSFTPHLDDDCTDMTYASVGQQKRMKLAGSNDEVQHYPSESADGRDLLEFTPPKSASSAPTLNYQWTARRNTMPSFAKWAPAPSVAPQIDSGVGLNEHADQQKEIHILVQHQASGQRSVEMEGGGLLASNEREVYEARLREMEARVTALETTQRDESRWAKSMGRFLYDANEKVLESLRDILAGMETLQRLSAGLLDGQETVEQHKNEGE